MRTRSRLRFVLEGVEGILGLGVAVVLWPVAGWWLRGWGSRRSERERDWVGDDLIAPRTRATTRAITIRAPAAMVWQWIVQLGLGRAGFYSYELLERLGGIPIRNVESIEPAWQTLSIGDEVLLHPEAGIRASLVSNGEHICFGKRTAHGEDIADGSWSLYVDQEPGDACRLVVRACSGPREGSLGKRLVGGLEAALDFVMEQRMLRSIKRLCELRPHRTR